MKNKTFFLIVILLVAASIIFWGWMFQYPASEYQTAEVEQPEVTEITMYRGEGCNCCIKWADYLEMEGFDVTDRLVDDLIEVKIESGISQELASCHTAVIDGYIVEGHVPANEIRRLLREQPDAIGIAVPGMPIGSPGMEQGFQQDPYNVILFNETGDRSVFARY